MIDFTSRIQSEIGDPEIQHLAVVRNARKTWNRKRTVMTWVLSWDELALEIQRVISNHMITTMCLNKILLFKISPKFSISFVDHPNIFKDDNICFNAHRA